MLNNPPFMLSLPILPLTRAQAEGSEGEGSKHENYFQQSAGPHELVRTGGPDLSGNGTPIMNSHQGEK